jgi:hypothetical protein
MGVESIGTVNAGVDAKYTDHKAFEMSPSNFMK